MPTALRHLSAVQFGIEGTPGTLVAADTVLLADAVYTFTEENAQSMWPRGVRTAYAGDERTTRRHSGLVIETDLDFEQICLFLDTGLVSVSPTGAGPFTYTYDVDPSAALSLKAATYEVVSDDGTTKHLEQEFGYGTVRSITIDIPEDGLAGLSAEIFGRAEQASTQTAALSALSRETIPTAAFEYFFDSAWASLGGTKYTGSVRSSSLRIVGGAEPEWTQEARADLDWGALASNDLEVELTITMLDDANAAIERAAYLANTLRAVRLHAAGTSNRDLQIDIAGKYLTPPTPSDDGNQKLLTYTLTGMYDPTGAKALVATVVNNLSGI